MVDTYLRALVYEPTNIDPLNNGAVIGRRPTGMHRSYLDDPPTKLPKYLEEFAAPQTKIFKGPTMLECKGVTSCRHKFLKVDGFNKCANCKENVCSHCQGRVNDAVYCLTCYAAELMVPSSSSKDGLQIQVMRQELATK